MEIIYRKIQQVPANEIRKLLVLVLAGTELIFFPVASMFWI